MFLGLFMKTKCKGEPTLILFQSGSYTFMGCKSINQSSSRIQVVYNLFIKSFYRIKVKILCL